MIRIPTRTHGIIDLVLSTALIAAPFIIDALNNSNSNRNNEEDTNGIANTLLPAMGAGILAQGLITDHELGAVKALSMPAHLTMDIGLGAFMIASPWVLDMEEELAIPMVALGIAQVGLALLTQTEPIYKQLEGTLDDTDSFMEEIAHIL